VPVAFLRAGRRGGCVPVVADEFLLGAEPTCTLCEPGPGVAPRHATLTYRTGEYILAARDGLSVLVNDVSMPLMPLRDGDAVRLVAGGGEWVFRNRLEGAFRPPGASQAQAWMGHPAFRDAANGPEAFGLGEGVGGRDPARCRRVGAVVVKGLGPARSLGEADHHLALLAAVGGASHAGMAALIDGGLAPGEGDAPLRWIARGWVRGTSARERVVAGGVSPPEVLAILEPVADALALLHRRGVVHRDVSPGNVVVTAEGRGVLIDFGQARLAAVGTPPSRGVVGTPGYVAPEEVLGEGAAVAPAVDVYGLAAVGYALLTGQAPAAGEDVLAMLAQATARPPRPSELGIEVPEALDSVLIQGLGRDPAQRPSVTAFARALAFSRTQLGLGGVAR
jgi:hypothetical protein